MGLISPLLLGFPRLIPLHTLFRSELIRPTTNPGTKCIPHRAISLKTGGWQGTFFLDYPFAQEYFSLIIFIVLH